jgi:hypothetical protein
MIKNLQAGIKDNAFVAVKKNVNWCNELVNHLKSRDNKAWYNIRQLVADEQITDFQTAYRYMFEHLNEFSYGNDAELSIVLDDFIWRASVVPDKEINFSACIARILDTNKKKVL